MGKWTGVVTNAGNELLNEWASGRTLRITEAEAGSGTAPEAALLAQTDVAGLLENSGVSLTGHSRIPGGVQLRIQIAAPAESYTLRQLGVRAALDGGEPVLLALFQNLEGVPIQSRQDYPDFSYTFYGAVAMDNAGRFEVRVDPSAFVSLETLLAAIDQLKLELMTNELTLPLAASGSGEALLSSSGTPLLAAYRPDGKSAAAMAAVAELEGRLAKEIAKTAEGLAADCASASSLARAYADGRVLALERAVDEKLADQAAETKEDIRAAKAEAVSAASADAAEKANAAKAEAVSAAGTAAAEKDKIVEKRLIYRIANDISKHDNSADSHPGFLASKSKMAPPIVAPTIPEDVQDILDDYIDILDRGTTPKEEF